MHRSDSKSRAVWTRNERFCIGHKRIRSIYSSWRTHVLWWWATKPKEYDTFPIDMKRRTQCCIISGSHTLIFKFVVCMFIGESVLVRCSNMSNSSDNIDKHNHTNGRRRTSCTETKRKRFFERTPKFVRAAVKTKAIHNWNAHVDEKERAGHTMWIEWILYV